MNTRIFNLIIKNLEKSFNLPKYNNTRLELNSKSVIHELPWTPARYLKFQNAIKQELNFDTVDVNGTIDTVVNALDARYLNRFFGEIWNQKTETYTYSGWNLVDEINNQHPNAVLDVGCGYHPFKGRIHNLIGIDPYNNCAEYMVDILDFNITESLFDHILVLGSLNFNSHDDIDQRFAKIVSLLAPNGKIYIRANPGILHPSGPYVDIFAWSFEIAYNFATQYNLSLETFKKDNNNRLFFVYLKK